jgi:hypothetical protein
MKDYLFIEYIIDEKNNLVKIETPEIKQIQKLIKEGFQVQKSMTTEKGSKHQIYVRLFK